MALITPLVHPLAMTGIVVIFVIFILLQREDLRNRLIRLAGAHDLQKTTLAIDEAGYRLSRLLLAQLALNAGFGLVIGLGLWLIGVPSAPLWGLLAMALRFVPYIGAVIAAILPLIVAAAVGEGWSMVLWTAALFLIVEPLAGHVVEPMLYGHSSGLSPVAVVVSATFWTWLWGPIGLVLATPLTICLVVLGRHVDRLEFLEVLLGNEPALSPSQLVYQRLLAGDPVEAIDQAEEFLKDKLLIEYYDDVLLDGIRLAGLDARKGLLEEDRAVRIKETVAEVLEDLSSHQDITPEKAVPAESSFQAFGADRSGNRAERGGNKRTPRRNGERSASYAFRGLDNLMKPLRSSLLMCCENEASACAPNRRGHCRSRGSLRWTQKTFPLFACALLRVRQRLKSDMSFVDYGERCLKRSSSSHFSEITIWARRQNNCAKRPRLMRLKLPWTASESAWSATPNTHYSCHL